MIFTLTNPATFQKPMPRYLNDFFSKNTLLLTDPDIEALDPDRWNTRLGHVTQFVADNNIQTIVLDTTANPVMLNNNNGCPPPTIIDMMQDLNNVTTTYILTSDFSYYYKPQPNIIFFSPFLWLIGQKFIEKYVRPQRHNTLYDIEFTKKTKTLMSLNINATWHRIYLFSLLAEKSWFNDIGYSFHAITGYNENLSFQHRLTMNAVSRYMSPQECKVAESYSHLLPIIIPNDEYAKEKRMWTYGGSSIDNWVYRCYAINLVTETSLTEGIILTEKITKPFMAYQIPILIGPVGGSQFLEDIGFDMFSDYIPWKTWDHVEDHKLRIRMIVEFLDSLLSNPTAEDDILLAHQQFYKRLIKNKEYFHSTEFENILLKQIRSHVG